ncbi:hypothetical protein BI036_gp100 [Morganella phage vB_MmoM_MP1]|uniref:Uncharacterized protein n=1 Tax=Morganella phage vB_MmoM_MP1 TaxID=1852628 RepID=A0A192YCE2_9CAUD|nr:hypothetical protein BI036_gp100 [Morganella phage vB_MmoM_MP1]ANM46541.1 hypothetical protein MP1_gp0099 [Morganella phage vB_MmoM_MP1]
MNLYAENMKYIQNHMDEKAEYHKEFEYHSDRLLYEFRFVNLNYGRQTGKSRGIAEFMAHEKIKNPKRDIILASYRAAMWDDIKRNYRNHCFEYGLVPTKIQCLPVLVVIQQNELLIMVHGGINLEE